MITKKDFIKIAEIKQHIKNIQKPLFNKGNIKVEGGLKE